MRAAARTGCDGWRVVLPISPGSRGAIKLTLAFGFLWLALGTSAADSSAVSDFSKSVQPILSKYCYDCHADGANKGGIAFDELKTGDKILDHDLWLKVLKNTRAGLMPPQKKPRH